MASSTVEYGWSSVRLLISMVFAVLLSLVISTVVTLDHGVDSALRYDLCVGSDGGLDVGGNV